MQFDIRFFYKSLKKEAFLDEQRACVKLSQVRIDSRAVQENDVFVAIKGARFDGHDFVAAALQQGAALCITSRPDYASHPQCLHVSDTTAALGDLARAWCDVWRSQPRALPARIGAITGSAGKTTVKEMVALILRETFGEREVLATKGNLNNHLGLPLTLLSLRVEHRFAVVEMGMNHAGELRYLSDIARPDVALVTNILRAHIGCGFNNLSDIAAAKSEIFEGSCDVLGIYPAFDCHANVLQVALKGKNTLTFGEGLNAPRRDQLNAQAPDIRASDIQLSATASHFTLHVLDETAVVILPLAGWHNVANALAAASLAHALGVKIHDIAQALTKFHPANCRLQAVQSPAGAWLLDDTYNANPDSFKAALDVLSSYPEPRALIMGDMGELGRDLAPTLHAEVGAYAQRIGVQVALFIGENSYFACQAFGADGKWFKSQNEALQVACDIAQPGVTVLVKGSRFMRMENVVKAMLAP